MRARAGAASGLVGGLVGALVVTGVPATAFDRADGLKPARASDTVVDVAADDVVFRPSRLRPGSTRQAGLLPGPVRQLPRDLRSYLEPSPDRPLYAGGVVLASRHGVVPVFAAAGKALRYADADTELPADEQLPARRGTMYDLASITKLFTSIALVQQVEAGRLDLDEPVATYLPEFAQNGKEDITARDLLTHTAGLPAWLPLYSAYDTVEEREAAVLAATPATEPGEAYLYSDIGLITLGLLVEEVSGLPLDRAVADGITGPLGMRDTMFNPPARLRSRIAATEAQPVTGRTMVHGEVHDENAWSLGGVAGHAGIFSTAHDLAVLARTLLNGGRYGDARILEEESVRQMITDQNPDLPSNAARGLGFELDQRWYMDGMSTPVTFGHTGFTGTSLVIDPLADSFVVLLTNRVHPSRDWGSNNPARRAMARGLARSVAVDPLQGDRAWFSGLADATTVTLTTPALRAGSLDFGLWYDTEEGFDELTVEASTDGGETWSALPFALGDEMVADDGTVSGFGGRVWHDASAALPASTGPVQVRWRYATDAANLGRGVYVDRVQLDGRPVADGRLIPQGWERSAN